MQHLWQFARSFQDPITSHFRLLHSQSILPLQSPLHTKWLSPFIRSAPHGRWSRTPHQRALADRYAIQRELDSATSSRLATFGDPVIVSLLFFFFSGVTRANGALGEIAGASDTFQVGSVMRWIAGHCGAISGACLISSLKCNNEDYGP